MLVVHTEKCTMEPGRRGQRLVQSICILETMVWSWDDDDDDDNNVAQCVFVLSRAC